MPLIKSFAEWASENNKPTQADVLSHVNAGLRSAPTTKAYRRWFDREHRRLQAEVRSAENEYRALSESGEIVSPPQESRIARLKRAASGHEDNPSTRAARRLLAKMSAQ